MNKGKRSNSRRWGIRVHQIVRLTNGQTQPRSFLISHDQSKRRRPDVWPSEQAALARIAELNTTKDRRAPNVLELEWSPELL